MSDATDPELCSLITNVSTTYCLPYVLFGHKNVRKSLSNISNMEKSSKNI